MAAVDDRASRFPKLTVARSRALDRTLTAVFDGNERSHWQPSTLCADDLTHLRTFGNRLRVPRLALAVWVTGSLDFSITWERVCERCRIADLGRGEQIDNPFIKDSLMMHQPRLWLCEASVPRPPEAIRIDAIVDNLQAQNLSAEATNGGRRLGFLPPRCARLREPIGDTALTTSYFKCAPSVH